MMSFIIDNYSLWDKVYRWTHNILAITTPILTAIQAIYNSQYCTQDSTSQVSSGESSTSQGSGTTAVVLGFIVAGMLKLKDYVTYDKVRDVAKEQTVKFQQLYEHIEMEMLKPENKRQSESEFIYWASREYQHIDITTPELSNNERKKFLQLCKDRGLPYNEDIEELNKLVHETDEKDEKDEKTEKIDIVIQPNLTNITTTIPTTTIPNLTDQPTIPNLQVEQKVEQKVEQQVDRQVDQQSNSTNLPTMHKVLSIKTDYNTLQQMSYGVQDDASNEAKKKYKDTLKKLNSERHWLQFK